VQAIIPFEAVSFYPFSWFDDLLETQTNPQSIYFEIPAAGEISTWVAEANIEIAHIYRVLREQTFGLHAPSEIRPVIEQYLEAIDFHITQIQFNVTLLDLQPEISEFLLKLYQLLSNLTSRIIHRYNKYLPEHRREKQTVKKKSLDAKLTCTLSADQIGVILKAADDTKIVLAPSLSKVYQIIIPFLSTTQRTELSWKSVRSNSYHPEQVDKDAAITSLEALIQTIRSYR
jgi:hypothetical protein